MANRMKTRNAVRRLRALGIDVSNNGKTELMFRAPHGERFYVMNASAKDVATGVAAKIRKLEKEAKACKSFSDAV